MVFILMWIFTASVIFLLLRELPKKIDRGLQAREEAALFEEIEEWRRELE